MINAINELFNTGDPANIELGIMQVEAQGLDFSAFPLLAGARSLARQIGGDWQEYATPKLKLSDVGLSGVLDLRAYGPALQELRCGGNGLTALDVRCCAKLRELYCHDNQLTALDVRDCVALRQLGCYGNQIAALDVRDCVALQVLGCGNNQLTALDVRECGELKNLYCSDNQIAALDVRGCVLLRALHCSNNQIEWINATDCSSLEKILFFENRRPIKIYVPKQYPNKCYIFGHDDCQTTII